MIFKVDTVAKLGLYSLSSCRVAYTSASGVGMGSKCRTLFFAKRAPQRDHVVSLSISSSIMFFFPLAPYVFLEYLVYFDVSTEGVFMSGHNTLLKIIKGTEV